MFQVSSGCAVSIYISWISGFQSSLVYLILYESEPKPRFWLWGLVKQCQTWSNMLVSHMGHIPHSSSECLAHDQATYGLTHGLAHRPQLYTAYDDYYRLQSGYTFTRRALNFTWTDPDTMTFSKPGFTIVFESACSERLPVTKAARCGGRVHLRTSRLEILWNRGDIGWVNFR